MKNGRILQAGLVSMLFLSHCTMAYAAPEYDFGAGLKSHGIIQYQDSGGGGTVKIDSGDLYDMAAQIDEIHRTIDKFKEVVTARENEMHTWFTKQPTEIPLDVAKNLYITHIEPKNSDKIEASSLGVDTVLSSISLTQTVPTDVQQYGYPVGTGLYVQHDGRLTEDAEGNTPLSIGQASADSLSAGTAAWVDGQLLLGTGADNGAFYDTGYADGYDDGYADGYDDGYEEGYDKGWDDGYTEGESKVNNTVTNLIDVIYSGINQNETVSIFPDRGSPDMGESVASTESCGPYYCYAKSDPIQAWDLESDTKKLITKLTINGYWDWGGGRDDDGATTGSYSASIRVYNERGEQIGSGYFSRWGGTNVIDCMAMRIDTPTIYVELDGAVAVSKSDHGHGTGTATIDFKNITATYLVN